MWNCNKPNCLTSKYVYVPRFSFEPVLTRYFKTQTKLEHVTARLKLDLDVFQHDKNI